MQALPQHGKHQQPHGAAAALAAVAVLGTAAAAAVLPREAECAAAAPVPPPFLPGSPPAPPQQRGWLPGWLTAGLPFGGGSKEEASDMERQYVDAIHQDPRVAVVLAFALPLLSLSFGYAPPPGTLAAAAAAVEPCLDDLRPWEVAVLLWGAGRLGYTPAPSLLAALQARVAGILRALPGSPEGFTPQEAAMAAWALSALQAQTPELWAAAVGYVAACPPAALDEVALLHLWQAAMFADRTAITSAAPGAAAGSTAAHVPRMRSASDEARATLAAGGCPLPLITRAEQVYRAASRQPGFDGPQLIELTMLRMLVTIYQELGTSVAYQPFFEDLGLVDLQHARQLLADPYLLEKFKSDVADKRSRQNAFTRTLVDVSRTLRSLGLHHVVQAPVEDGLVHVDVALPDYRIAFFLETPARPAAAAASGARGGGGDGGSAGSRHGTLASLDAEGTMLSGYMANETPGTKAAKLRMLQQRGWVVLPLRWTDNIGGEAEKRRLLLEQLDAAGQQQLMRGRVSSMLHGAMRTAEESKLGGERYARRLGRAVMSKRPAAGRDGDAGPDVKLPTATPVWLHASEDDKYLLLEDPETGDVLMPLIYLKAIFQANYSRKLAAMKHRQVTAPANSPLAEKSGLLYWQWAFEAPLSVKAIVRKELGEDNTPQGHLRLVLVPIVYNALAVREDMHALPLFRALHKALRRSSYWPLLVPPAGSAFEELEAEAEAAESGAAAAEGAPGQQRAQQAPLFAGPTTLEASATKYMTLFSSTDEVDQLKRARTTGGMLQHDGPTVKAAIQRMCSASQPVDASCAASQGGDSTNDACDPAEGGAAAAGVEPRSRRAAEGQREEPARRRSSTPAAARDGGHGPAGGAGAPKAAGPAAHRLDSLPMLPVRRPFGVGAGGGDPLAGMRSQLGAAEAQPARAGDAQHLLLAQMRHMLQQELLPLQQQVEVLSEEVNNLKRAVLSRLPPLAGKAGEPSASLPPTWPVINQQKADEVAQQLEEVHRELAAVTADADLRAMLQQQLGMQTSSRRQQEQNSLNMVLDQFSSGPLRGLREVLPPPGGGAPLTRTGVGGGRPPCPMPRKTNNSQPSRQQQPSVDTLAAAAGVLAQTANGTVLGGPPRDAGGRGGTGRGGVPSDINDILQNGDGLNWSQLLSDLGTGGLDAALQALTQQQSQQHGGGRQPHQQHQQQQQHGRASTAPGSGGRGGGGHDDMGTLDDSAQAALAAEQHKVARLQAAQAAGAQALQAEQGEREAAEARADELGTEVVRLSSELEQLWRHTLKEQAASAAAMQHAAALAAQHATPMVAALTVQARTAEASLAAQQQENARLQQQLAASQAAMQSLEERFKASQAAAQGLRQQLAEEAWRAERGIQHEEQTAYEDAYGWEWGADGSGGVAAAAEEAQEEEGPLPAEVAEAAAPAAAAAESATGGQEAQHERQASGADIAPAGTPARAAGATAAEEPAALPTPPQAPEGGGQLNAAAAVFVPRCAALAALPMDPSLEGFDVNSRSAECRAHGQVSAPDHRMDAGTSTLRLGWRPGLLRRPMAVDTDTIAAVQAALEAAELVRQDLELACDLQRHEFFGSDDEGASLGSSFADESLLSEVQAAELEVAQLTQHLQLLKDAQLAQELHVELLSAAVQQARDHSLAATIGDCRDEGPSAAAVASLAETLPECSPDNTICLRLHYAAEMKAEEPGEAGCGALITSPAGDEMWRGSELLSSATHQEALLIALCLGLKSAAALGLGSGGTLVLLGPSTKLVQTLQARSAHSSTVGALVDEVGQLLDASFAHWREETRGGEAAEQAQQLARAALWPSASKQPASAAARPEAEDLVAGSDKQQCENAWRSCQRPASMSSAGACTASAAAACLGCDTSIADAECELLLSAENSDTLKQVMAEASIPEQARFYCPNRRCSAPFPLDREPQPDTPSFCPACDSKICTHCRVVWHKGFRCAEYQALPSTDRQPEDLALLQEAARRQWQRCAQCKHMIELGEGCRHITCRCGYEFCFSCGAPWEKVPGQRSHQTCKCDLFVPPPEEPAAARGQEEGEGLPVPVGLNAFMRALMPAVQQDTADRPPADVPGHVRPVYKTRLCNFYSTAGGCTRRHCWFAHGAGELRMPRAGGSVPAPPGYEPLHSNDGYYQYFDSPVGSDSDGAAISRAPRALPLHKRDAMPPRGRAQPPKKQPLKSTKAVVALCIVGLPIAFAAFLVGVAGVLVLMDEPDRTKWYSQTPAADLWRSLIQKNPFYATICVNGGLVTMLFLGTRLWDHRKAVAAEAALQKRVKARKAQ
ncbi:E3 ubiquitin-ligase ARI4 [Micractinium conductrix]|uniref:RBR-type E3 ubiquitin transferase n=1 Tax=Micractinium conductrix TaxID=554055 RepID=A0A2P6VPU4_9CHLO|nr:E3 ubiquitin-ligase ARI4 [Micractinium conductrix]|eukprot:PSC76100.1 E3 ubiquitin-ligase ARI4 [Micractinium conductrix]